MSKNWMRHFELQLLDDNGKGISLSDLKVTFKIGKMTNSIFNGSVGDFKVYNLSPDTQNLIMGKEFKRIRVIAGYKGDRDAEGNYPDENIGLIFNGDIRFTISGKNNITSEKDKNTDSWIQIQCLDSWEGHLNASVKTTVAAGWKYGDILGLGMESLGFYGITAGSVGQLPDTVFPRGRVIYKSTNVLMNDITQKCDAHWWYENNQVNIVPRTKYIQKAVVLNADTGLIGMPQQKMDAGINVRCLINPNIKLGGLVRIDQESVYRVALSNDQIAGKQNAGERLRETETNGNLYIDGIAGSQKASINTDGDYIVGSIDYIGDTRGQNWYMDLLCQAKGSADLLNEKGSDGTQQT